MQDRRAELRRQHSIYSSNVELVINSVQTNHEFVERKIHRRHSERHGHEDSKMEQLFTSHSSRQMTTTSSSLLLSGNSISSRQGQSLLSAPLEEEDENNSERFDDVDAKLLENYSIATAATTTSANAITTTNSSYNNQQHYNDMALAFVGVIVGGVSANVSFEYLNQLDPGCGSVITLLQYLVAVAEHMRNAPMYIKEPAIPYRFHVTFCALLFLASWLGNTCLAYDLPFPLFLVIKNSNLVFTLLVGYITLNKRYQVAQVISVFLVSLGVVLAVLEQKQGGGHDEDSSSKTSLIGILLCVGSTLAMALLSCTQEYAFVRYKLKTGKTATHEAMFFTHVLGLPFFLATFGTLWNHVLSLAAQWRFSVMLIIFNVSAMVLCKTNIFRLMDMSSSALTTTLAITCSRCVGIVASVFLSKDQQPGRQFWVGAMLVVAGSLGYLFGSGSGKKKMKTK